MHAAATNGGGDLLAVAMSGVGLVALAAGAVVVAIKLRTTAAVVFAAA